MITELISVKLITKIFFCYPLFILLLSGEWKGRDGNSHSNLLYHGRWESSERRYYSSKPSFQAAGWWGSGEKPLSVFLSSPLLPANCTEKTVRSNHICARSNFINHVIVVYNHKVGAMLKKLPMFWSLCLYWATWSLTATVKGWPKNIGHVEACLKDLACWWGCPGWMHLEVVINSISSQATSFQRAI